MADFEVALAFDPDEAGTLMAPPVGYGVEDPEIDLAPGPVMGAANGPEARVARDPEVLDPPEAVA
jgi:hypothetical protein